MKLIEQVILSRRGDLKLMNPDLLYSLVLAFSNAKMQSELLYLVEPHILARTQEFNAG